MLNLKLLFLFYLSDILLKFKLKSAILIDFLFLFYFQNI